LNAQRMDDELLNRVAAVTEGPAHPQSIYEAEATQADVYATAAGFLARWEAEAPDGAICVCAERRAVIAAALIAAMAAGRECILPFALSRNALETVRESLRFDAAVVDGDRDLPDGVRPIHPSRAAWRGSLCSNPRKVFLHLFTGGTTGAPVGWRKTPLNLIGEAMYLANTYHIGSDDCIAATVPPYHIYGLLFTVLIPLVSSASVLAGTFVYPEEVRRAVRDLGASILVSVPVHYRSFKEADVAGPKLRLAFSSAGPLDGEDSIAFYRTTGIGVEEIYGSTETGGIAARCQATGRDILEPFACVRWKIKDERLMIASPFLSPDLPLQGGYYRTGDRAITAGSGFTLLGRADGVVKVGGRRVSLQRVQDVIKKLPGVCDAVVVSLPSHTGRAVEIAAAVDADLTEEKIRAALQSKLEPYEMPRRIRIVSPIPAVSTGKYNREAIMRLFADDERKGG